MDGCVAGLFFLFFLHFHSYFQWGKCLFIMCNLQLYATVITFSMPLGRCWFSCDWIQICNCKILNKSLFPKTCPWHFNWQIDRRKILWKCFFFFCFFFFCFSYFLNFCVFFKKFSLTSASFFHLCDCFCSIFNL